jgi:hypothetical protein
MTIKRRVQALEKKRMTEYVTFTIAGVTLQGTLHEIYERIVAAAAKQGPIPGAPPRSDMGREKN